MTPEANLKAWFSGSKIVDSEGNPLRLYHGTGKGPEGEDAYFVPGQGGYIYATPDHDYAEAYNIGLGGQTFPLYARAMKPLDLRTLGEGPVSREQLKDTCGTAGVKVPFGDESAIYKAVFQWVKMWGFKEACEDAGYDAIWLRERAGNAEGDALLLFDSWQLKSAIGNRGTYDKEDPRLIASQDDDRTADWLYRHNIHVIDGKVTFYHATPKETAPIIEKEGLREGSLLEDSPERAIFYARRDRELPPEDVVCFSVTVQPSALRYGIWPSAREAIPPALLKRVSLDAKTASSFTLRQEPSRGDFLDSLQNVAVEGEKSPISRQSSEEATYYHVTPHSKTPRILAQGLVTGKPRQWKNPLGAPLGERDRIYLHTDLDSAIQFGFRMQWDTQKPVDILQITASTPDIELDSHVEAQMRGTWVMTSTPITPDRIKRVIALTPELVQDYVARDQAKYRQASAAPTLRTSNPGGEWLQEQQKASKEGGTDRFGCPRVWGAVTASFTSDVLMPVTILATIPGMRGEQGNVRPDTMSWMMENMGATQRLPQVNDQDYTPFIMVDCNGRPWVNEGNHRIMTAAKLGWPYLPVELRYFAGGEQARTGIMAPQKVLQRHQDAERRGFNLENYALKDPLDVKNQKQAKHVTDSPEFLVWFGASKAVHPDGTPMLFYHGTSKDQAFTSFKDNRRGIFFTPDPQGASDYAANNDSQGSKYNPDTRRWEQVHTAPRVIPVYLRVLNPYKLEGAEAEGYLHAPNYAQFQRDLADRVKMGGHDGIIYPDGSWVVFDPAQAKSAIGNSGKFNPKDKKLIASEQASVGMNVNDSQAPWTQMILQGLKTIETRDSDSLSPHVGERVGIIRTGQGPATLVGYCTLGEPKVYRTTQEWQADAQRHRVGGELAPGAVKFGYPLSNVEPVDPPQPVTSQGRVFRKLAAESQLPALLDALRALPCAADLWVFGSVAHEKENPGDIDVFLNRKVMTYPEFVKTSEAQDLLALARKYYGGLDPFVLLASEKNPEQRVLIVRNDHATGWQTARNAKEISQRIVADRKRLNTVQIHTAATREEAFKAWFKDSKVVDAEGKPLVVIHQTDVSFTTFLRKHLGQNTLDNASDKWYAQTSKIGFWFASSDAKSMHYMPGDIQMEVYLSLQNPVCYPTLAHLANLLEWERLSGEAFRKRMMAQGYDGLVIEKDEEVMGRSYVAFHSNQIKSVANAGTFDPKKRSIMAGPIQKSGAKLFQKRRADAPPVTELQKSPAQRVQDTAKAHPLQSPELTDPTRTPEFQAWFRDSKVVDRRGRPRVVYHGSTHAFDKFDMSRGNEGNFYGKGFYFTDSKEDVNSNYGTNQGRDLQSRIDERAEELMNNTFTEEDDGTVQGLGSAEALELARKEIAGQSTGMVYLTYLRIVNPVVVQPRGGTHFEGVSIDPKDEDNIIESRQFIKLYKATLRASEELGARGDRIWEEATQDLDTLDGFTAFQFEQGIRQGDECMEVSGGPGPLIARIWQLMGFDGIIMDAEGIFKGRGMDMSPGTQHYIVWNPRQVKSAIGNSGAFNPRSKRLVAEDLLALLQKKASV